MASLLNANPTVYEVKRKNKITFELINNTGGDEDGDDDDDDENVYENVNSSEIFDLIRGLNDPEHPLTLEQLNVVNEEHILVNDDNNEILVQFTPTIPHCSMATLIGLSIRVKLLRSLSPRFKVTIKVRHIISFSELLFIIPFIELT